MPLVAGAGLYTEAENYGVTIHCCDINYLLVLLPVSHDEDLDTLTMLAEPGHNDLPIYSPSNLVTRCSASFCHLHKGEDEEII